MMRQIVLFSRAAKETWKYSVFMEPTGGRPAITPALQNLDRSRNSQFPQAATADLEGNGVLEVKEMRDKSQSRLVRVSNKLLPNRFAINILQVTH